MSEQTYELSKVLLPELKSELAKTRKFLERVPDGHNDFKPNDKSRSLIELANHLATVSGLAASILTSSGADLGSPTDPRRIVKEQKPSAILAPFDELADKAVTELQQTSDSAFNKHWEARQQGRTLFSDTRYMAFRNIAVNHIIHHRAQLGGYLRHLGIAVPASFGPSADEMPTQTRTYRFGWFFIAQSPLQAHDYRS